MIYTNALRNLIARMPLSNTIAHPRGNGLLGPRRPKLATSQMPYAIRAGTNSQHKKAAKNEALPKRRMG